jgi:hypothetical protein
VPIAKIYLFHTAFILYRQHHQASVAAANPGLPNPEISKIIGDQWRQQSDEVKDTWKKLADEEKVRHQIQYPDYRYQPRRGGKSSGRRLSTGSGDESGHCFKCGGRYIATPRTPSTPFTTHSSNKTTMNINPYSPLGSRLSESEYVRHSGISGQVLGRQLFSFHQQGGLRDIEEDFEQVSPSSDPKRRRYNSPGGYNSIQSPTNHLGHRPVRQSRPPSISGVPLSAVGYSATPFSGPVMLAIPAASGGPMAPPPRRVSASYSSSHGRGPSFDESLRLPPLQTQLSHPRATPSTPSDGKSNSSLVAGLGIMNQREGRAKSIEALVMTIPYINKLKVLNKISPPLLKPSARGLDVEVRGAFIAIDGPNPHLLKEVGSAVEKAVLVSGEVALKIWRDDMTASSNSEASSVISLSASGNIAETRTGTKPVGSGNDDDGRLLAKYLQKIMKWHELSEQIAQYITTHPPPSKTDASQVSKTTTDDSDPGTKCVSRRQRSGDPLPKIGVALVPDGFSLTLSDRFACSVPILDSYAPVDHWQWMATLWRGIIGPDLVIYVRPSTEEEILRHGSVELKSASLLVVRVSNGTGLDEKTERRIGFEIIEWVRAGSFKGGFAQVS